MDEQWVRETLGSHIENDQIVLDRYEDGSPKMVIDIPTFVQLFFVDVPTYDSLVATQYGSYYEPYFAQWRDEGLLN